MDTVTYRRPCETADFSFLNYWLAGVREARKLVYFLVAIGVVLGVVLVLVMPYNYTAMAKVMPAMKNSPSSSLSGLLPGVTMFSQTATQVDLYQELFKSNLVRRRVLTHYGIGPPEDSSASPPKTQFADNKKVIQAAVAATNFFGNYKSGVVTISTSATDAKLSADIANIFVEQLDIRLQELDKDMAFKVGGYFARQVADQRKELREVEEKRAEFLAKNRNYSFGDDPEMRLQLERLEMDVGFQRQLLLSLLQLKANNNLEMEKSVPRLMVIEWATTPSKQSPLIRIRSVLFITLGAGIFAIGLVFLRATYLWYVPPATRNELVHSYNSLGLDAQEVVRRIRRPFKLPAQTKV